MAVFISRYFGYCLNIERIGIHQPDKEVLFPLYLLSIEINY